MAYVAAKKKGVLIPSGPASDPDRFHVFAITTDRCNRGNHLLVPISSIKPGKFHDLTSEIAAGNHPKLPKDSYAEYRFAKLYHCDHIAICIDGWLWKQTDDFSDALVQYIFDGVLKSPFTPNFIKRHVRRWPRG
jgi:hypothetical protein